jgi:hypothetical protein
LPVYKTNGTGSYCQPQEEQFMSGNRKPEPCQSNIYRIRLRGHLSDQWTNWFEGFAITLEDGGDTLLTGPVVDQAALFGLLKKVRDLGLPLVSINCVEPGCPDVPEVKLRYSAKSLKRRK